MITFEEAKKTAALLLPGICRCLEFSNAWLFANKNSRFAIGGEDMPVIILKETGDAIDSTAFYDSMAGYIVREFDC